MARVSIFLIIVALISGTVGCASPPLAQYDLTISSTEGGSVIDPGEGTFGYDEVTVVNLVAEPDEGYQFANWTGDVTTIGNVNAAMTIITTDDSYEIRANFALESLEIRDWYDLDAVRNNLGGSYILMNDLDSVTAGYEELAGSTANGGKGWQPIAGRDDPFIGSFDGQTHEIRNLLIKRSGEDWVGLFGCIGKGGTIENVRLENVVMVGHSCVGGIAGQVYGGTVKSCRSAGSVAGDSDVGGVVGVNSLGGTMQDTYSTCSVSGHHAVGGLVGATHTATVSNSYSTGSVTGESAVGGLVGLNLGTVSDSYSAGSVAGSVAVGGLIGQHYYNSIVTNCYSSGSVAGYQRTGGLVGYNQGGTITKCYSVAGVTGDSSVGGLVGFSEPPDATSSFWDAESSGCAESDGGTAKTTSEMRDILTFSRQSWDIVAVAHGETNRDYIWSIVNGVSYPFLSWQSVS